MALTTDERTEEANRSGLADTYEEMDQDFRDQFSQDEFTGQKQQEARGRALQAAKDSVGGSRLSPEQRAHIRGTADVEHMHELDDSRQYYTTGEDGKRVRTSLKDSDPFSNVKDLKDFDLAAYGVGAAENKQVLNRHDVAGLADRGGFSYEELDAYAKSLDEGQVGIGARRFLDEKLAAMKPTELPPTPVKPEAEVIKNEYVQNIVDQNQGGSNSGGGGFSTPNTSSQSSTTASTPGGGGGMSQDVQQDQDFSRTFGNNYNTIGDANTFYGSFNQGNQDFSVNIGSQNVSQGGSGGGSATSTAFNNMQNAVAYNALNENQYKRSQAQMTGIGRGAAASGAAESIVGAKNRVKGLDTATDMMSSYYRDLAKKQGVMAFGDYTNPYYEAPTWKSPANPARIGVNLDDDENDIGNGIKTQ